MFRFQNFWANQLEYELRNGQDRSMGVVRLISARFDDCFGIGVFEK